MPNLHGKLKTMICIFYTAYNTKKYTIFVYIYRLFLYILQYLGNIWVLNALIIRCGCLCVHFNHFGNICVCFGIY